MTTYALIERVLGGFNIGRFYELTTNPNGNWIVSFIGVVMGGYVSNKWVKGRVENPPTSTKESSTPPESR